MENPYSSALLHEPQVLRTLLPIGAHALQLEDQALSLAFAQARQHKHPCNRGLGYTVFESNLVYAIFKSWLPLAEVYWEFPYPGSSEKADLVVCEGGEPFIVLEAKWWMNSWKRTRDVLDSDVRKLLSWSQPIAKRVLLAFWYSRDTPNDWSKDLEDVNAYCEVQGEAFLRPIFVSRFATDCVASLGSNAYFAAAAVTVEPRRL